MDEKGANIDLVFRNGLKDFEVLPPQEVWDNIHPVIKRKQRSFILIRAAALIAVLLALSFLTYRWSREVSAGLDSTVMALDEEAASPGISPSIDKPFIFAVGENKAPENSPKTFIENIPENDIVAENKVTTSPEVAYLQEYSSLSVSKTESFYGPLLASLNSPQKMSFENKEPDQQFLPENPTLNSTERWSVAAMASPTYYSMFSSGNDVISKQLKASEQPLISYSGGVAFSYKINKRFSIQSGLYFSSLGQEVDGINSFSGFQNYNYTKGSRNFEVLTSNGTLYTNNGDVFLSANGPGERILTNYTSDVFNPEKANLRPLSNTLRQNFSYLELPIVLRYKVVDKMIDFSLIGGVSYNLLVNNSVYTMSGGTKYPIGKTDGLNPISLSSSLGMGMEYNFSDNLSLNLEPTFRYYLNPFNEITGSKIHPYTFGIFSGLSYKF
ncbi:MAG: outer membrane beta-barrel protein [Bacteroidia bacterium]|nr:outer membrane beta-barrel protein [Bacteroidia bacterium]